MTGVTTGATTGAGRADGRTTGVTQRRRCERERFVLLVCALCWLSAATTATGSQCRRCAEGEFCFEEQVSTCPQFSTSPRGSDDAADCVCGGGYHMQVTATSDGDSTRTCQACAPDHYCEGDNSQRACPAGSAAPAMSSGPDDCLCEEGRARTGGGACEPCAAGLFKDVVSDGACSKCAPDTYQPATGAASPTECLACPANTVAPQASTALAACVPAAGHYGGTGAAATACPAGTYQDQQGQTTCLQCADVGETWSDSVGATSAATCAACPANSVAVPTVGGPGGDPVMRRRRLLSVSTSATDAGQCQCNAGFFAAGGANGDACVACAGGTFKAAVGPEACTACAADTFHAGTGATSAAACAACTPHSGAPAGSDAQSDCACDAGFEAGGANGLGCVPCAPGSVRAGGADATAGDAAEAAEACAPCPAGTWARNTTHCEACPALSWSAAGAAAASACACRAGAFGEAGGPCAACEAGTYAASPAQAACASCSAGSYQPGVGATACEACPEHSAARAAGAASVAACECDAGFEGQHGACSACAAGTFRNASAGATTCALCAADTFQPAGAQTACEQCPAHQRSAAGSDALADCACGAGYTGASGVGCAACAAGSFKAAPGAALCGGCAAGSFSAPAATACALCGAGSFQPGTGASACVACRNHSVLLTEGGVAALDCECAAGHFLEVGGGSEVGGGAPACRACRHGEYKSGAGNAACTACPAGTHTAQRGSTAPAQCLPCAADRYTDGGLCLACPPDAQAAAGSAGAAACRCNAGFTGSDGGPCAPCAAGSFKDSVGAAGCTPCGSGQVAAAGAEGAATAAVCAACPAGTYAWNATACARCPAHAESAAGSALRTDCRCAPGFTGPDGGPCAPCGAGLYKAAAGAAACSPCAFGTYSPLPQATSAANCSACPAHTTQVTPPPYAAVSTCVCTAGHTPSAHGCVACGWGRFKAAPGDGACLACPAGTYYPDVPTRAADLCAVCPARSSSPAGSGGLAACVCGPGTRREAGGGAGGGAAHVNCTLCAAGSYCPREDVVQACPELSHSRAGASALHGCECVAGHFGANGSCAACPVGAFCPEGATAARACPGNSSTRALQGQAECTCVAGFFALEPGRADGACAPCPRGSFCFHDAQTQCPGNSTAVARSGARADCQCFPGFATAGAAAVFACRRCGPGELCTGGHAPPVACAPGAASNNSACRCPPGAFCAGAGGGVAAPAASCEAPLACAPCPADHYCHSNRQLSCPAAMSAPPGAASSAACECGPGSYRELGECRVCPEGAFCPDGSLVWCAALDPHFEARGTGHASKHACGCRAGSFRLTAEDACKLCPPDSYCPGEHAWGAALPNVGACMEHALSPPGSTSSGDCQCIIGFKQTQDGPTVKCAPCEAGQRCAGGSVLQSGCHEENRVPNADHSKCVCVAGFAETFFACVQCAPGSFKAADGDTHCAWCPANTFWVNRTRCAPCPPGSTSAPGSLGCECAAGLVMSAGACVGCAEDEFWAAGGGGLGLTQGACEPCPARSRAPAGSVGVGACACDAGTHRIHDSNGTACAPCAAGTFELHGACRACALGAVSAAGSTASAQCVCNSSATTCHRPTWRVPHFDMFTCEGECVALSAQCAPCAPGTAKPHPGGADCQPCAPGSYAEEHGQALCTACPPRATHVHHGQVSRSACKCEPGTRLDDEITWEVMPDAYVLDRAVVDLHLELNLTNPPDVYQNAQAYTWGAGGVQECRDICSQLISNKFNNLNKNPYAKYGCVGFTLGPPGRPDIRTTCFFFDLWCDDGWGLIADSDPPAYWDPVCHLKTIHSDPTGAWVHNGDRWAMGSTTHNKQTYWWSPGRFDGGWAVHMAFVPAQYQQCAECALGFAKPYLGNHACAACELGEFQDARGQPACKSCARETAYAAHANASRYVRNANTTQDVASVSVADCVCVPGFFAQASSPHRSSCQPCEPGAFKALAGNHSCDFCGAFVDHAGTSFEHHYGSASPASTAQNCAACPAFSGQDPAAVGPGSAMAAAADCLCFPGHTAWSLAGCQECPAFLHKTHYSNAPCAPCADGHYFVGKAAACEPCELRDAAGGLHALLVVNMHNASLGYAYEESDCDCLPGYERQLDACVACAAGSSRGAPLPRQCAPCALHTYAAAPATAACTACPTHSTTNATGSSSVLQCLCDPGFQRNDATQTCEPCPAGSARDGPGNAPCEACALGFFSLGGATACTPCGAHEATSGTGSGHPDLCFCEPGFGGGASHAACQPCAPGSFSAGGQGAASAAARRPACALCPRGKNCTAQSTAVEDCTCRPGHGTRSPAPLPADACAACVSGKFSPGGVNEPCLPCGWGALSRNASTSVDDCECNANAGVYEVEF